MKKIILVLFVLSLAVACKNEYPEKEENTRIEPVSNQVLETAVIYEANIRQYSPEGTFEAFTRDIPKLRQLGVRVLWLMPIHPISLKKRKATGEQSIEDITDEEERGKYLGSYYAVADYSEVNPELGDAEDFRELVETAHKQGIYVILDWVANHTGWDHHWIEEHPEFYTRNEKGEIVDPLNPATGESWGWTDVADLNYDHPGLHQAMREEMKFWVREFGIDGFRADVAGEVPTEFWEYTIAELKEERPLFMLAESEDKDLFIKAFDMGYNWEGHHLMNEIAQGRKSVKEWDAYMLKIDTTYQEDDYLMNFVTNHDENSWSGSVRERMGEASESMLALSYTIPGMPLIYSGQEYDLNRRLKFFEKDSIPKKKGEVWPVLEKLGRLKNDHKALHGAKNNASYERLPTSRDEKVLAFRREKEGEEIVFIANLSDEPAVFHLDLQGEYKDYMRGEDREISKETQWEFNSWEWIILSNR